MQAVRAVEAAGPGKGEALEREVRALRRVMFDHSILSMNAVPDRIFDRAAREGWKHRSYESLRAVARVAPLSVPLWAWLVREDAVRFRLEEFLSDVDGLSGALHQYGPGLLGYVVWLVLFASASACWFAVWASLNLFLRARPAMTSDVARLFKGLPRPEIFASGVVLAGFAAPVACGVGIAAAAVFWIALSTAYLRRGELVIGGTAILLLVGVFLCGGFLEAVRPLAGTTWQGGWLGGEGYYSRDVSDSGDEGRGLLTGPQWERMARFARARAEMQGGNLRKAESLWTELIGGGRGRGSRRRLQQPRDRSGPPRQDGGRVGRFRGRGEAQPDRRPGPMERLPAVPAGVPPRAGRPDPAGRLGRHPQPRPLRLPRRGDDPRRVGRLADADRRRVEYLVLRAGRTASGRPAEASSATSSSAPFPGDGSRRSWRQGWSGRRCGNSSPARSG